MGGNMQVKRITKNQYKTLSDRIDKITGFNKKINGFEKKIDILEIKVKTLENENNMLRRIVKNLQDKVRGL
jgi:prophage DNA circulation protein